MPKFSKASLDQLATCHPDLQVIFNEVIKTFDCQVLEGHRGKEQQEKEFNEGDSKLHYPFGRHNAIPSNAADVSPYPVDWKNINRFYWFAGYVMATAQKLYEMGLVKHKVRYGGDWDKDYDITDNNFNDLVHFELIP